MLSWEGQDEAVIAFGISEMLRVHNGTTHVRMSHILSQWEQTGDESLKRHGRIVLGILQHSEKTHNAAMSLVA